MKNLAIKVAGANGGIKDITIAPGTTAGEVLKRLALDDYVLTKGTDSAPFKSNDNIYPEVEDGSKLYAITKAEVAEELPPLNSFLFDIDEQEKIIIPSIIDSIFIERDNSPEWKFRGWVKYGSVYKGYYRTMYGVFKGEAHEKLSGGYKFYIIDPPKELKNNSHWVCFHYENEDKFSVHFNRDVYDLDTGILRIEPLINESFKMHYWGVKYSEK